MYIAVNVCSGEVSVNVLNIGMPVEQVPVANFKYGNTIKFMMYDPVISLGIGLYCILTMLLYSFKYGHTSISRCLVLISLFSLPESQATTRRFATPYSKV